MKASEYLERKQAQKKARHSARRDAYWARKRVRRDTWEVVPGDRRGVYAGEHGFIMCGTTADIDTPEKRSAIAAAVLGLTAEQAEEYRLRAEAADTLAVMVDEP